MRASPAAKVAAVATAAIAAVYIIGVIVLNLVVARHMTDKDDARLAERITAARQDPDKLSRRAARSGSDPAGGGRAATSTPTPTPTQPVFLWSADARGIDNRT